MDTSKTLSSEHLVIVRTGGSIINLASYNCQELGLAQALIKKGLKVSLILAGTKNEEKVFEHEGFKIKIYFLKYISINQALSYFFNLHSLLSQLSPTVIQIHEFGMLMSYSTLLWANKRNIKTILIQGSYQTTQKPVFKQLEILYNQTFGKYLLNHVHSIGCKSLMAAQYIHRYSTKPTHATYIGLDINKFQNEIEIDWINKLHLNGKKILLYIGILEKRRNPLFLAQVMEKLPSNYVLLIAGDGPLYKTVKEYSELHNLTEKITLLGRLKQEEVPSLYKASDLFLLPSNYEIYGMVILESMYFGTPVVSTMTAGAEVLIKNNEDGIIINEELNENHWAQKIQEIIENFDALKEMSHKASLKIRNNFVWDKACDRFLKIYGF